MCDNPPLTPGTPRWMPQRAWASGGGLGMTSRVSPVRRDPDVRHHRDAGEIGLSSFFHHRLQPVSDLSNTLVWCFEEDFVMDGAHDDGSGPLQGLGERHQGTFDDICRTALDRAVVDRPNPRGLWPPPPAATQ